MTAHNENELLPCPFCGKQPLVKKATIKGADNTAQCMNDYCAFWDTMPLDEWNTRYEPAPTVKNTRTRKKSDGDKIKKL